LKISSVIMRRIRTSSSSVARVGSLAEKAVMAGVKWWRASPPMS
jgi:hypothetical protein